MLVSYFAVLEITEGQLNDGKTIWKSLIGLNFIYILLWLCEVYCHTELICFARKYWMRDKWSNCLLDLIS